ncbi:MAG: hypothetical protein EOO11_14035 [Chitinophagaceae bacterium]|nr:MAG: hypothetical protein EOO11_14035 [Chitinophagaceae bacterium]
MSDANERKIDDRGSRTARPTDEEATQAARDESSSDRYGQGAHPGLADDPSGDDWAENKVATSLDDE